MYNVIKILGRTFFGRTKAVAFHKWAEPVKTLLEFAMVFIAFRILAEGYSFTTFIIAMIVIFSCIFDVLPE